MTDAMPLDRVLTADEFRRLAMPSFSVEADYTEEHNENRTLADYLSDVSGFCDRALAGEITFRADALPSPGDPRDLHQRYADYMAVREG